MGIGRIAIILVIVIAAAIGLYIVTRSTPQPEPLQAQTEVRIAKFTAVSPPRPAPEAGFASYDGKPRNLADYRGHWLLINLWATWCGPCIKEMPTLAKLREQLKSEIEIVAISEDRKGKDAIDPFLNPLHIDPQMVGIDQSGAFTTLLKVQGLPMSFLFDPKGDLVATLEGAADWQHPETIKALRALMAKPPS